jgi:hypothetical protein
MLLAYLRRHIKIILMLFLFVAVFSAVFSLYELPLEAVLYAALLCFCIGAALFAVGYSRWLRHHRELKALLGRVTVSLDELPAPSAPWRETIRISCARCGLKKQGSRPGT